MFSSTSAKYAEDAGDVIWTEAEQHGYICPGAGSITAHGHQAACLDRTQKGRDSLLNTQLSKNMRIIIRFLLMIQEQSSPGTIKRHAIAMRKKQIM